MTDPQTPRARRRPVHELIAPKEPLLLFRGQSAALLLPAILGLMALLATFFALQSAQRLYELHESLGLANSELTVFIPSTPGLTPSETDPVVDRALNTLQNTAGLGRIELLDRVETRALVEQALGDSVKAQVPLPTIISVKRARRTTLDVEGLRASLDRAAPGTVLDDNLDLRQHLTRARSSELTKGLAILAAVLIVVSITAALVIGQSVDLQASVIDVLYISGAPDRLILSQFVGFALRSALLGVGSGAALGWLMEVIFWPRVLSEPNTLLPLQLPVVLLTASLLVAVSVVTARWNVLRKLKRTF